MIEASTIIAPMPSRVIACLAKQAAIKAVKHELKARRVQVWNMLPKDIAQLAEEYIAEHRDELFAQAWERVRTSRELLRLYEKEHREWLRRLARHCSKNARSLNSNANAGA
jgi:hypothetical protein